MSVSEQRHCKDVAGKIVELDNSISFEDALTKADTVLIATGIKKKVKSRHCFYGDRQAEN